jgi:flagellar basal-body rod modification protein FlgD
MTISTDLSNAATVGANAAAAVSAATNTTGSKNTISADSFLTLLVTQMKNQDPMNPMDSSQMTSQLAQISTVTGIGTLNASVQQLLGDNATNQTLSAANMIGQGVLVYGKSLALDQGQAIFGVELPQPADSVLVSIKDASGKVVHSMNLGAQQSGVLALAWDGATDSGSAAPAGTYSFSVTATQTGKNVTANALSRAVVLGVTQGTKGPQLNLGASGTASLSDIKQIL